MRSHALLGSAVLAASANANPFRIRQLNSSTLSSLSAGVSSHESSASESTPSPIFITSTSSSRASSLISSSSDSSSISLTSSENLISSTATTWTTTSSEISLSSTATWTTTSSVSSETSLSTANTTTPVTTNGTTPAPTECTGCILEAYSPTTVWYDEEDTEAPAWTSVVVTETILTEYITYLDGTTIDTIVTESKTVNQTKTVVFGSANQTITHTTPYFTFVPAFGTQITLDAGPTYVFYTNIYGALDRNSWLPEETGTLPEPIETEILTILEPETPEPTCDPKVERILYQYPTVTEDWRYFIQTYSDGVPDGSEGTAVPLPPALVDYLKKDPDVQSTFSGSDIATCTVRETNGPSKTPITTSHEPFLSISVGFPPEETVPVTVPVTASLVQPVPTRTTDTYLSTTYESTSAHVTRYGCLRCDTAAPAPIPGPTNGPEIPPGINGPQSHAPKPPKPDDKPENNVNTPDLPGLIASIINDPAFTANPNRPQHNPGQSITVGDSVVPIRPAQPTQPAHPNNQPDEPNNQNKPTLPGVVIGSETLTPGQTTTMNGVEIVVPTGGDHPSIVVDGSTIAVNPVATGSPVLTVGDKTVTANPQGQFVVGTETLTPGGPAITVDGSTLSLGPSGTIAVVNGVTQTLGNAPAITGAPALTVDGQTIQATVIGGSTMFILGPDQTLTPGGVLIVDGTTFSMPKDGSGSTVVVNGVTSTLNAPGLPVLTLNTQSVTASVIGGTTAFILGPGQTLTPGGVITVSGTTYSMPAFASGSVVVINGVTSTLGQAPITSAAALTINGKTYSATVRDGTTEYVLGPGTTLKPGEAVTISGTTYSLDPKGTALVINGKTSTIPSTPASNSATTTKSDSKSKSGSTSESASSTSERRNPGNFIASGIGISSTGGALVGRGIGFDKWVEGWVIGLAGWVLMFV